MTDRAPSSPLSWQISGQCMGWNYCIRQHSELVVIWQQANQHLNMGSAEPRSQGRVDRQRERGQGELKMIQTQGNSKNQRRHRHKKKYQQRFPSCGAETVKSRQSINELPTCSCYWLSVNPMGDPLTPHPLLKKKPNIRNKRKSWVESFLDPASNALC